MVRGCHWIAGQTRPGVLRYARKVSGRNADQPTAPHQRTMLNADQPTAPHQRTMLGMELLAEKMVQLIWHEDRLCARLGFADRRKPAGFGSTVPEALRDLARAIEESDIKVWVPRPAKPYVED